MIWRRSYDTPPPPIDRDSEWANFNDPRYAALPTEARPETECLKDVLLRALPYWYDEIAPDLYAGKVVLVAAHGNSLRAIVKHLDQIGDAEVVALNIPTGIPLVYELDDDLKPVQAGGSYLDPEAAAAAIEAVKNQGKK
jgi:2,3-bisphosphoglycerate-dependent phosphoglycerate mutase